MGMGMIFTWLAYERDTTKTLDLMVQAAFKTMSSDVLIDSAVRFHGLFGRTRQPDRKVFKSLHLAMARIAWLGGGHARPDNAIFATATGIVGAVVTLMGLLALPAMLRPASVHLPARSPRAVAGDFDPPSVLIVYGATAGCPWCSRQGFFPV
jgi:TRAP-type mannitol/chloroaromatic compound transport system permease large subunit